MMNNSCKKFFKGKKVLITGNTGFVGSHLSLTLSLMGAKVLGLSQKKKHKGYISNFKKYKDRIKTIDSDIININRKFKLLKKFKPSLAIHLASQPVVLTSYKKTRETFKTNILGTVEFLEVIKKIPSIKSIIVFTSDKVYENKKNKFLYEGSKLGGLDPYSASKSSQDIIANSYKESFFKKSKNLIIIRAGNIIGGGDFEFSRLIPDLYKCIFMKKKLILRNSRAVRPWQHILDVVNGVISIIFKTSSKIKSKSIIYNIGPNIKSNITVINLIKKIKKINKKLTFYEENQIRFNEKKKLKLSNKLIKKEIDWTPLLNINQTILLTNNWYSQYYKNPKTIYDFTVNQIKKILRFI